jgi:hypothetical protein
METEAAFKTIATQNSEQTLKVLDALSNLTDWMNTVQESIDNIDRRLKLIEKTENHQDKEKKPHKFTEEYGKQQRDFYN